MAMANEVRDYLRNGLSEESGIKDSIRTLILQFYGRARRRRVSALLVLVVIFLIVVAGIFAVLFVGRLMELDTVFALRSRDALIEETTQRMEQTTTEAIKLATSALEGTTWVRQDSGSDFPLMGVHFVDAQTGWAVGWNGTILATSDGGATWERQTSATSRELEDVHFVDAQTGWAVGWNGTILATSDGGATWERQTGDPSQRWYGIHFVDAQMGWVVGWEGTILATSDGGATWEKQTSGTFSAFAWYTFRGCTDGLGRWVGGDDSGNQ